MPANTNIPIAPTPQQIRVQKERERAIELGKKKLIETVWVNITHQMRI